MWDDVLLYVIIGFVAQMIDGAIGMAYGVTSTSVLLSLGVPPATARITDHTPCAQLRHAFDYQREAIGRVVPGRLHPAAVLAAEAKRTKPSGRGMAPPVDRFDFAWRHLHVRHFDSPSLSAGLPLTR